jgi:hypothetical protein
MEQGGGSQKIPVSKNKLNMSKLYIDPDCGNAPRKSWLAKYWNAILKGQSSFIKQSLDDAVEFFFADGSKGVGVDQALQMIRSLPAAHARSIWINSMITHGKEAAVQGRIIAKGGDTYSFCEIYRFRSAGSSVFRSVTSFWVVQNNVNQVK